MEGLSARLKARKRFKALGVKDFRPEEVRASDGANVFHAFCSLCENTVCTHTSDHHPGGLTGATTEVQIERYIVIFIQTDFVLEGLGTSLSKPLGSLSRFPTRIEEPLGYNSGTAIPYSVQQWKVGKVLGSRKIFPTLQRDFVVFL